MAVFQSLRSLLRFGFRSGCPVVSSSFASLVSAATGLALLSASPRASAWGAVGHHDINRLAILCLPAELRPLYTANQDWIVQHSIDPDLWREQDHSEGPHHFIDLDTWGESAVVSFPEQYPVACGLYGKAAVDKNGVVPWRIGEYYGKLVRAFKAGDGRTIVEISAWLGHYAADIHVPFHAAANYDGQLTGQKGIHARFESILLERQIRFEDLKPLPAVPLKDPVIAAFDWARTSLRLSREVLRADKMAVGRDSSYGDTYYKAFGVQARPIALRRLQEGARDLASLWLSAWITAGRPAPLSPTNVHAAESLDRPTHDPDK